MKNYFLNYRIDNRNGYITCIAKDIFGAIEILNKETEGAIVTYVYCEESIPTFNKDLFPKD